MARNIDINYARNRFNQKTGRRVGAPIRTSRFTGERDIQRRKTPEAREAVRALVQHGAGGVSAATKKQTKQWKGGVSDPIKTANKTFQKIYDNLTNELSTVTLPASPIEEYNQQIADENAIHREYAATVLDQQTNPVDPINNPYIDPDMAAEVREKYPDITDEELNQLFAPGPSLSGTYLGKPIMKVIEQIANAGSAIPSGIVAGQKALYEARDEDASTGEKLKAAFSQAARGLNDPWQKEQGDPFIGWGEIYEQHQKNSPDPVAGALRNLEEKYPWAEQAIARLAGLGGDIAFDPIGKVISLTKTGVIGGQRATSQAARDYNRRLGDKIAAQMEDDVITGAVKLPGGHRWHASEQASSDNITATLNELVEKSEYEVNAGGSAGRWEMTNPHMTAQAAGVHGGKAVQEQLTGGFSMRVQRVVNGLEGRGQKLDGNALRANEMLNPDFSEFLDDLTVEMADKKRIAYGASRDELAAVIGKGDVKTLRTIENELVDRKYGTFIQDSSNTITREYRGSYYNTPGIRIRIPRVGTKVIPVKGVGKAFATINKGLVGTRLDNFRYNAIFPGSLGLDTTRARAWGVPAQEAFEADLRKRASKFTREEGKELQRAIENNLAVPSHMQAIKKWIMDQYADMYTKEWVAGVRGRTRDGKDLTPYDPNYAHVATRGKSVQRRSDWKQDRKETIHANIRDGISPAAGRYKTANALQDDLRPIEDAFEALRNRRIKHSRDMTRAKFRSDMIDTYGIVARINPAMKGYAAEGRNLTKIEYHHLPEQLRQQIQHTGEDVYLPTAMADALDEFDRITKWNGIDQAQITRVFTKVMNLIKRLQTVPWAGFHNKNIIGDVFMSLLDNVNFDDYMRVFKAYLRKKAGKETYFKDVPLKGHKGKSFTDHWNAYSSEANSGFASTELGNLTTTSKSIVDAPRRTLHKAEKAFQDWSGYREDAGRFTHYVTAYQQEAKALWKKGERDLAVIDRKAKNAALWRVNNYKFDYNALALWEKQTKTLAFPYYTFLRKAAPTLVQALYQDPRWITQWYKFLYEHSVTGQPGAAGFDPFKVPQSIRDIGYGFLPGEAEKDQPWYVSGDILPTSTFGAVDTENSGAFFNSILTQMNLPAQIAIEQATGQQLFLDRPLPQDQSFAEYLMQKMPGTREATQAFNPDKSWRERLLSARAFGGLPIRQIRENQQLFAENEWKDELIDDPIDRINKKQDLYHVSTQYPSPGVSVFAVKNNNLKDASGQSTVEATFYTAEEAINYVEQSLPEGYDKVQRTWDIDNQGNPVHRPLLNEPTG